MGAGVAGTSGPTASLNAVLASSYATGRVTPQHQSTEAVGATGLVWWSWTSKIVRFATAIQVCFLNWVREFSVVNMILCCYNWLFLISICLLTQGTLSGVSETRASRTAEEFVCIRNKAELTPAYVCLVISSSSTLNQRETLPSRDVQVKTTFPTLSFMLGVNHLLGITLFGFWILDLCHPTLLVINSMKILGCK